MEFSCLTLIFVGVKVQSGKTLKNYKSRGAYGGVFDKFQVVFRSFLAENMRFFGLRSRERVKIRRKRLKIAL